MENKADLYLGLKYIGSPYKCDTMEESLVLKREILNSYDEFQLKKLEFLNECYTNERTMITYWTIYTKNIHIFEYNSNRDVMNFNKEDIISMIEALSFSYNTSKQNLVSFLNNYFRWCEKRGEVSINPITSIDVQEVTKDSKIFMENKIYGKNMFWSMIDKMMSNTNKYNVTPIILARYGITGYNYEPMVNLKWSDIDRDNMVINVSGKILPIDDTFIRYMDNIRNDIDSYSDTYILENNKTGDKLAYRTVFNRVNDACLSINIPRIPLKTLVMTRQLEMLLDIRKTKRLTSKDFERVVLMFDFEDKKTIANKVFQLKKRYLNITNNDVVVTSRNNTKGYGDENSLEISNKYRSKYDLYL